MGTARGGEIPAFTGTEGAGGVLLPSRVVVGTKRGGSKKMVHIELDDSRLSRAPSTSGGRAPKGVVPPHLQGWLAHLKSVRAQLPAGTPYKVAMQEASKSYRR